MEICSAKRYFFMKIAGDFFPRKNKVKFFFGDGDI